MCVCVYPKCVACKTMHIYIYMHDTVCHVQYAMYAMDVRFPISFHYDKDHLHLPHLGQRQEIVALLKIHSVFLLASGGTDTEIRSTGSLMQSHQVRLTGTSAATATTASTTGTTTNTIVTTTTSFAPIETGA